MEDKDTREQYHEMIREKNKLKDRQRKTNTAAESESDSSGSSDEDELKEKAIREIKEEMSDSEQSEQAAVHKNSRGRAMSNTLYRIPDKNLFLFNAFLTPI